MRLVRDNVERVVVDEATAIRLKEQGFREMNPPATEPVKEHDPVDLSSLKVEQLRAVAKERDIDGAGSLTKAQLLELLEGDANDGTSEIDEADG